MGITPITVSRKSSLEERQAALRQIYRQVLERQPYEHEHQILAKLEKDFLTDKIGVRRFLRELGCSDLYLSAFYYKASNPKFLEWCFKHFMGRALVDQAEVQFYCEILVKEGIPKLIAAILDSEEYRKVFGCFTVPYPRQESQYASPKAYLESRTLNEEHVGQRGHALPTIFWHKLGLICKAGVCRHPEADEILDLPISETGEMELLALLKALDVARAKQVVASLSPTQKEALRKAIYR